MSDILGILDPIRYGEAWHTVIVGGIQSPGVCEVKEWKRAHEWDQKKGRGAKGAVLTLIQKPPAKGSIEFKLWTSKHFSQWDDFYMSLQYDPEKKKAQAIGLFHPSLAAIDVTSAVTEFIGNPVHQGQGMYTITVEFIEFIVPASSSGVGTPTGSVDIGGNPPEAYAASPPPEDANDALSRRISNDYAELGRLGGN